MNHLKEKPGMPDEPNGTPKPGVLTFTYDPTTNSVTWKQEGAFSLPALVNALEVCKAVQINRQLQEQMARAVQEQMKKVQPAQGLFRG